MKEKIQKIYNISTASLFSIYALIAIILLIFLPKYNILFKGWWAFILILPSLGGLLFNNNKLTNLYICILGIFIILLNNEILTLNKCFTILICIGIIFVGINVIISTLKIPIKRNSNTKKLPFYYVLLGSTEEKIESTFSGGYSKTIFGYMSLDLKNSKIEEDSTLKVLSLFGETEIFLPKNIEVITNNTNLLGETENLRISESKKKMNKLYIESISIFGSTKIR